MIVDADVASSAFRQPTDAEAIPLVEWIEKRDGRFIVGGKLAEELFHNDRVRHYVIEALRRGDAIRVTSDAVRAEEERLDNSQLRSNDIHVIALARASGARILYSHDQDVHQDFRNPRLITEPRGRVYQQQRHAHLLHHDPSCRPV